jgi:hypothetical protein
MLYDGCRKYHSSKNGQKCHCYGLHPTLPLCRKLIDTISGIQKEKPNPNPILPVKTGQYPEKRKPS